MSETDSILVVAEKIVAELRKKLPLVPKLEDIHVDHVTKTVVCVGKNGAAVEMDVTKFVSIFSTNL